MHKLKSILFCLVLGLLVNAFGQGNDRSRLHEVHTAEGKLLKGKHLYGEALEEFKLGLNYATTIEEELRVKIEIAEIYRLGVKIRI